MGQAAPKKKPSRRRGRKSASSDVQIKKVRFRQSGGFAGLVRGSEAAGKDITDAQRKALERHARNVRAAPSEKSSRARDMVMYELDIDTDAGPMRLEFDDASVPDDLEALVKELSKRAKPTSP
jgi:hypothetical protein